MARKPAIWAAAIAMAVVVIGTVAFFGMRGHGESNSTTDCDVVSALFIEWTDTLAAAQQELVNSNDGHEGTLALADAEAELAGRIRAAKEDIESPDIAEDLERWAAGAELGAQGRRDEIDNANPDITAPPPRNYVEGAMAVQTATSGLVVKCPSARPPDTQS